MKVELATELFLSLGGNLNNGFPYIDSPVYSTKKGTPYLKRPGVALVSKPSVELSGVQPFLDGFDPKLGFADYLKDPTNLEDSTQAVKLAGQICYSSFDENRTKNEDVSKYVRNLVSSGHGSVLEHANISTLLWGVSRSLTHEEVRHRAGRAYSQLSQRYVNGRVLRFVERPEYQNDQQLHQQFEERIDRIAQEYEDTTQRLLELQKNDQLLSGMTARDRRKKVQQSTRSLLPNETETSLFITQNVRALRHVSSMRGSEHAEVEIRKSSVMTFLCAAMVFPILLEDFEVVNFADGTLGLKTDYPKV